MRMVLVKLARGCGKAALGLASAAAGGLILLLGGYFIGWQSVTVPEPVRAAGEAVARTARTEEGTPAPRLRSAGLSFEAHARAAELLRLLSPGRDERLAESRLVVALAGMSEEEVRGIAVALESSPPFESVQRMRLYVMRRWASLSPRAAFDYAKEKLAHLEEVGGAGSFERAVLLRWAQSDPYAALHAWQELAPHDEDELFTMRTLFMILGQRDPGQAIAAVDMMAPEHREEALRGVATQAANGEAREEILRHLTSMRDPELRSAAIGQAVFSWARSAHPTEAAAWVEESGLSRSEKARAREEIGEAWLHQNPPEAAEWLAGAAANASERARNLRQAVDHWAQHDPKACGEWLLRLGVNAETAPAMKLFARMIARDFPAEAAAWARGIPETTLRTEALASVREIVRERHPAEAARLLPNAAGN